MSLCCPNCTEDFKVKNVPDEVECLVSTNIYPDYGRNSTIGVPLQEVVNTNTTHFWKSNFIGDPSANTFDHMLSNLQAGNLTLGMNIIRPSGSSGLASIGILGICKTAISPQP